MKKILYTEFEQIGEAMSEFIASSALCGKLKKYNLKKVWGQVVGKRFESRSYPALIVNKVLKVACANSQITSELVMSKRMIMLKLKPLAQKIGLEIEDVIFSHKIWNPQDN